MTARIPLTLITGEVGAGKTTLLNALLCDASAGRTAVVVNEFGDVGLDHDHIIATTEETVLLSSGCICCTVRGDLVQALAGLIAKRSTGKLDFDRIVIETTGLADPAPILHTLIVTPGLGTALRLDGVVTVCDAVNGPATRRAAGKPRGAEDKADGSHSARLTRIANATIPSPWPKLRVAHATGH